MLLFISKLLDSFNSFFYFKTSYVTVYPAVAQNRNRKCIISKHRMLLFIIVFLPVLRKCSNISKHRMLLFINYVRKLQVFYNHFKTSYVTVYRV